MGLRSKSVCVFLGIITHRRCWSSPPYLLWSKVTRAVLIWSCRVAENESWTVEEITWRGEINISAALPVCTDHHESLFGSIQNVGSFTLLTLFPINMSYHMLAKVNIWKGLLFLSVGQLTRRNQQLRRRLLTCLYCWLTSRSTFLSTDVCRCVFPCCQKKVQLFKITCGRCLWPSELHTTCTALCEGCNTTPHKRKSYIRAATTGGPPVLTNLFAIKTMTLLIRNQEKSDHPCSDVVSWPHPKSLLPTNIFFTCRTIQQSICTK